jgi:hypothetical protein
VVPDQFAEFREEYDHVVPEVFRHMPITDWARAEMSQTEDRSGQPAEQREVDDVRDLMAGFRLPPQVASVTFARGCRIRRVRVPGDKATTQRGAAKGAHPTVILSRRALDEARTSR